MKPFALQPTNGDHRFVCREKRLDMIGDEFYFLVGIRYLFLDFIDKEIDPRIEDIALDLISSILRTALEIE